MKVILVLCLAAAAAGFPAGEPESDRGKIILPVVTWKEKQAVGEEKADETQQAKKKATLEEGTLTGGQLSKKEEQPKMGDTTKVDIKESMNNKYKTEVLSGAASTMTETKADMPQKTEEGMTVLLVVPERIVPAQTNAAVDHASSVKSPVGPGDAMFADAVGAVGGVAKSGVAIGTEAAVGGMTQSINPGRADALAGTLTQGQAGLLSIESNESCICAGAANTAIPSPAAMV